MENSFYDRDKIYRCTTSNEHKRTVVDTDNSLVSIFARKTLNRMKTRVKMYRNGTCRFDRLLTQAQRSLPLIPCLITPE